MNPLFSHLKDVIKEGGKSNYTLTLLAPFGGGLGEARVTPVGTQSAHDTLAANLVATTIDIPLVQAWLDSSPILWQPCLNDPAPQLPMAGSLSLQVTKGKATSVALNIPIFHPGNAIVLPKNMSWRNWHRTSKLLPNLRDLHNLLNLLPLLKGPFGSYETRNLSNQSSTFKSGTAMEQILVGDALSRRFQQTIRNKPTVEKIGLSVIAQMHYTSSPDLDAFHAAYA